MKTKIPNISRMQKDLRQGSLSPFNDEAMLDHLIAKPGSYQNALYGLRNALKSSLRHAGKHEEISMVSKPDPEEVYLNKFEKITDDLFGKGTVELNGILEEKRLNALLSEHDGQIEFCKNAVENILFNIGAPNSLNANPLDSVLSQFGSSPKIFSDKIEVLKKEMEVSYEKARKIHTQINEQAQQATLKVNRAIKQLKQLAREITDQRDKGAFPAESLDTVNKDLKIVNTNSENLMGSLEVFKIIQRISLTKQMEIKTKRDSASLKLSEVKKAVNISAPAPAPCSYK